MLCKLKRGFKLSSEWVQYILGIATTAVFALVGFLWNHFKERTDKNERAINEQKQYTDRSVAEIKKEFKELITESRTDIKLINERLLNLPTKDDIKELKSQINSMFEKIFEIKTKGKK